ncbi:MAG: DMT family transporter [Ruminococcus sp.]|nr:DMT family transporter [Ruminococcus sp.]
MDAKRILGNKIIAIVLATLCVTLWGTAFPVIKKCYGVFEIASNDYAGKVFFAGVRFLTAGVMVLIVGIIIEKSFIIPGKRDILPISVMGGFQIFLQYLFSYIGLSNTTGTKTSVITALSSFLGVIASPLFFKNDKITIRKFAGCLIGFAGIIAINLEGLFDGNLSFWGEGFVALSAAAGTTGNMYGKHISKGRNSTMISAYHLLFGGFTLLITGAAFGGSIHFNSAVKILLIIYLGFISAVSFTVWTALLKYNPVSRILIFNLLIPIFGTIWSGILLNEQIFSFANFVSVLLISSGIIMVNYHGKEDKNAN